MTPTVKVALVGISGYGDSYLEALFEQERGGQAELVGVVDPAAQRCKRLGELSRRGIPIHSTVEQLLAASSPELVMIASPIQFHASQTCQVLKAGASVLCEKPLAGSVRDGLRMLECQANAKGFVAIGFQWSFVPSVQALKNDIMAGVLGRPIRLKTIALFPRGLSYFKRNNWAGRLATPQGDHVFDSPVNNATSHYFHNMLYILGGSRETSAMPYELSAEVYRANEIENFDTAAIRCRIDGGAEVLFYTSHATSHRLGPKCSFEFEHATVEYDDAGSQEFVAHFHDGRTKRYGNPNPDRNEKIWQCIDAVRTGGPVACGIFAALPHAACVGAIHSAVRDIPVFPSDRVSLIETGEGSQVVVKDLHQSLVCAFEQGVLPAECRARADWARGYSPTAIPKPEWTTTTRRPAACAAT